MSEPVLLIDAGNSRIKWALADAQRTLVQIDCPQYRDPLA